MFLIDRVARTIGLVPQYKIIGTNGTMNYLNCVANNTAEMTPFSLRELISMTPTAMNTFKDCAVVFDLGRATVLQTSTAQNVS